MYYVPVLSISKKLNQAARTGEVLYIQGAIGTGKTAAVTHYLKRRKAVWHDGERGYLDIPLLEAPGAEEAFVVDNISSIRDFASKEYIRQVIYKGDRQIILIGRGSLPSWLAAVSAEVPFRFASAEDLLIDPEELEEVVSRDPRGIDRESAEQVIREASDNPLLFVTLLSCAVNGRLTDDDIARARIRYYHILDERFFDRLDREERAVLICLCNFDRFSSDMARIVSANNHIEKIFERLFLEDACLDIRGDEYFIPEPYLSYLRWKAAILLEPARRADIYRMAASYYASIDDLFTAAEYGRKAGDSDYVAELVFRICKDAKLVIHNLQKVSDCLDLLTVEQSVSTPLVMATRSLVFSLKMNPERSEVWSDRLDEYAARTDLGRSERCEADYYRAYLDLFLPHRGSEHLVERLIRYLEAKKRTNNADDYPSLTLYGPSIINGLMDMSALIGENRGIEQVRTAIREARQRLKEADSGIVKLLIQELALERAEVDDTSFETQINRIVLEGERQDKDDLCLTAVVQYAKGRLILGDSDRTGIIHQGFVNKHADEPYVVDEIERLDVWISLLRGESRRADQWFENAPDSRYFFSLADRYAYILKARIQIMRGEYQQAQVLLTRLTDVFDEYHRDYMWIKARLLMAVTLYRMGSPRWRACFEESVERAEKYGYIRVIADEGAAVSPLFDELKGGRKAYDAAWFGRLESAVREMAANYPNYLQETILGNVPFTKTEKRVISLMCRELSSSEICDQLHISYSGLKYHKGNIYRKLGVKTKEDALKTAKLMGIDG